jgi:anti-sigma factor RsiW
MSCLQHDVKAYLLGELPAAERRAMESHLNGCQDCRAELESLRLTRTALLALPDEEMPRRIAFVSDKVFEPRGWAWLWNSAPRLAFVSVTLLACAILVHAFLRPAAAPAPAGVSAVVEARLEREVTARVQVALEKTAAEQARQTASLVAAAEQEMAQQRQVDLLAMEESFAVLQKRLNTYQVASARFGGGQ